jgi:hypothetical protein
VRALVNIHEVREWREGGEDIHEREGRTVSEAETNEF